MAKQRQFTQTQLPKSASVPEHPNIALVERCHPEKIIEALAAKYFQDLRSFYGYSSPTFEEVRDFTRAIVSGEIDLENVPLAREAADSDLTKADTEDGKEFALALVAIAKRHNSPFDIDEEIVEQLFNRGLLPLYSLAPDQQTLNALARETGLSIARVTAVLVSIEQSDYELRSLTLSQMVDVFNEEKRQRIEHLTNAPAEITLPKVSQTKQPSRSGTRTTNERDYSEAEERLEEIMKVSTILTLDTSSMSELFDTKVLGMEPDLPTVETFLPAQEGDTSPIRIDMNPTNMWVNAVSTSRTRKVLVAPLSEMDAAFKVVPVDDRATRTLIHVLKARTTDVFIEAAIVNTTARFLLDNNVRNGDFLKAVKELENVVRGLDAIHKNTILTLRDVDGLQERIADTDRSWRKLANNPALADKDHGQWGSINLSDISNFGQDAAILASMIYHLPPGITETLFANTFGGMIWDLKDSSFKKRLDELDDMDADGTRMDQARGWRTRYGTTGRNIVSRDQGLGIQFEDKDELTRVLRPVSERYDPLFSRDPKIMDRDLHELPASERAIDIPLVPPTAGR